MTDYNVGQSVHFFAESVASKPRWLQWYQNFNQLSGYARLPSGHRRLVIADSNNVRVKSDCYVIPKTQSSTDAQWRAVIYAPNGSYIKATGLGDTPTIGTPTVRIGVNAPSKAVVRFPVLKGTPGNILASTFAGWSDGHAGAVSRGMEITVEYRDASTNTMRMAFRGMIYQIESGDVVTVTAYDRLMDLAQYSDQYQSHAGYTQNDTSKSRTVSGSNYVYTMHNSIGTLLSAATEDLMKIDATSGMGHGSMTKNMPRYIAHPLPSVNSYTVENGYKITHVKAKVYVGVIGVHNPNIQITATVTYTARVRILLYQRVNGVMIQDPSPTNYQTVTVSASGSSGTVSNYTEPTLEWDVDWTISGSDYYIAIELIKDGASTPSPTMWSSIGGGAYPEYSASRLTVSGNYYTSDGGSWTEVSSGDLPEIAIQFIHSGSSVTTSLFTVTGASMTIARASIPAGPSDGYLSPVDSGIKVIVSYFISGAAGIQGIIKDLLEWAGLVPDVVNENMGTTDYYTSSTYDYMTCIIELLRNGNYGLKALIDEPGKVIVRGRHTVSETPAKTFTTDPSVTGEQIILSHDLTAHWMAEKATQAYIAEDVTTSGLPVALETDDALMDNSLVEIMGAPMRSAIADSTLGTHNLQAYAAGGKMVQLHTNVFEGKMTLAGYRLDLWDLSTGNVGGLPIGIDIPEYGAQGTAIPTEIVLGDGVTQVCLDNIRTADRSEVANSMGLSADAISNNASAVPESVFIFARINHYSPLPKPTGGLVTVKLYDEDGVVATQSTSSYIKIVEDGAGYCHIAAIFPSSAQPSGYAPTKPINRVSVTLSSFGEYFAPLDNPKYAYDGQNVHVDVRFDYIR